ncbi:DEAD/DEAH box helicase family protein [Pseudoalteromonas fenneropenaei]|uniref:DEAD/DEAH box helicase family protein n=1 Tax=Pseudoalteromonas fenneropenaei TaxID=1737459 RepID=A0ABV7CP50_9GAMM
MNSALTHRQIVEECMSKNTFDHQQKAAHKVFEQFQSDSRAVVVAAEMQSGKSGIALALACLQRLSLPDEQIVERKHLKDTLYLVTMADTALQDQAMLDLAPCKNVVVSNFINFETALRAEFKYQQPKLIIIDECHYGSSSDSIRYDRIFSYLETDNLTCNVVFVSATPFSALYAASNDSILRHNFNTSLVFHKTSHEYLGVRQMHANNQIVKLDEGQRDFCDDSLLRKRFIRQFKEHQGTGWSLIRVPSSQAKLAQQILLDNDIEPEQIYIIGQKLVGLEEEELSSIDEFKREYETALLFNDKLIAITVAGFRAGVNFGQDMKNTLINTWDSTISNIAAVVQANIGRACGYHNNTLAKHYTNLDAVRAYSELLDVLESRADSRDFNGLDQYFDTICERYSVRGFDRGTVVAASPEYTQSKKLDDSKTYLTEQFFIIPAKLSDPSFDFSIYTHDAEVLQAIALIRQELLADEGPYRKARRALKGEHQNWIKAQWVNGATYDDGTASCAKARALKFTAQLAAGESVEFNLIVNPGGGEKTEDKRIMASIFSIYNLSSRQDILKRAMDTEDMEEICKALGAEYDDTLLLLYQRGCYSQSLSDAKSLNAEPLQASRIRHQSVF